MSDPKYDDLIERTKEGRFVKGQSGNPSGRSKVRSLTKAYRLQLESICPTDSKQRTWAEVIAERMAVLAAKGNVQAAVELADRVEGRVRQAFTEVDDEFEGMSVEELEAELERTRSERTARIAAAGPPPDGGYTQ